MTTQATSESSLAPSNNLSQGNISEPSPEESATLEEALTLTGWGKHNYITIAAGGFSVFSSILGKIDLYIAFFYIVNVSQFKGVNSKLISVGPIPID